MQLILHAVDICSYSQALDTQHSIANSYHVVTCHLPWMIYTPDGSLNRRLFEAVKCTIQVAGVTQSFLHDDVIMARYPFGIISTFASGFHRSIPLPRNQ